MATELVTTITDGPNPAVKVIALDGELDESNMEELKTQMDPILNDVNITSVIFNLEKLKFINSKGIGFLVSVHTHLAKDQRHLIISSATVEVMDVISLVGLTAIIPCFNTIEEALVTLN